jgi:hypothetical protein
MGGGLHSTSDESESTLLEIERVGRKAALTRATGFCGWFFSQEGVFFSECEDFFSESFLRFLRLLSVHSSDSLLANITLDFFPGGRPLRFSLIFTGLWGSSSSSESDEINGFDLIFDGGGGLGMLVGPFFRPLFFLAGSSTGSSFLIKTGGGFLSTDLADFSNDFLRSFFSFFAKVEYFLCKSVIGLDDVRERLLYDESLSQLLSQAFFFLSSSSSEDEVDEDEEDEESD